jgi:hypothetical protein
VGNRRWLPLTSFLQSLGQVWEVLWKALFRKVLVIRLSHYRA